MATDSLMNIGISSITAHRVAIDVTGENIANVNTPGYSRQRVTFVNAPVSTANGFPLGTGVEISSVQRVYDAVLTKQISDGNSAYGNSNATMTALQQVEPFFNELTSTSLADAMSQYFDSWQAVSMNPAGVAERQTLLGRAQIVVDTFHQINGSLKSVQEFTDRNISATTLDITMKAREIAGLNADIRQTEQVKSNANEMRDRRDLLIQELAQKVGVTYYEQADGMVNVVLMGGQQLVAGSQYANVHADPKAFADPNLANPGNVIRITNPGDPPSDPSDLDVDITATIGGTNNTKGEIGALLLARDTTIPGYLRKLDELAYNMSYSVNIQHYQGYNLNGDNKKEFFTPSTISSTAPPAPLATYEGYSNLIDLAISSPNEIAAADTNPLVYGTGNNKNALEMVKIANKQMTFDGGVVATLSSYYGSLASTVGVDVQTAQNLTTQNEGYLRQLNNLRESNSGVSLDEELTNLIKYQKAFEGAAKLISTATQMMDTVLNMTR